MPSKPRQTEFQSWDFILGPRMLRGSGLASRKLLQFCYIFNLFDRKQPRYPRAKSKFSFQFDEVS